MKKFYFLSIIDLNIFTFGAIFLLFFCFFLPKKLFASEPSSLYHNNLLIKNLAKEKAKKQAIIAKKQKTSNFNEYFAKNYGQIIENYFFKYKNQYKDHIAKKFKEKKFKNKKHIRKQQDWWWLLDLFFRSPEMGLFLLITLAIAVLLWLLFSGLGVAIAFEIILLISLVITLIGYIIIILA